MSTRKRYDDEFKENVVNMVLEQGMKLTEVSRAIGVHQNTVGAWVKKHQEENDLSELSQEEKELKALKKELAELKEENEILKKAAAFFAKNQK